MNNLGLFWSIDCLRKRILAKNLGELIKAAKQAYDFLTVCTIKDALIMLIFQMNKILCHGKGNNFPLPHTKKRQHEKKMGASICTIKPNVPSFMPTKAKPAYLLV